MRRSNLLVTLSLLALLFAATSRLTAQSGSGRAGGGVSTMTAGFGCWVCGGAEMAQYCTGGRGGSWNCTTTWAGLCNLSSPGCGVQGMLPLDPDGAAQYVSRELPGPGEAFTDGGPPVRRNCEGIIVARFQAPDNIAEVRARTGSLSL